MRIELRLTEGENPFQPAFELFDADEPSSPVASGEAGIFDLQHLAAGPYVLRLHQNLRRDRNNAYLNLRGMYSLRVDWPHSPPTFVRGDANADGQLNISDPVRVLEGLFVGGADRLTCESSADVDGNTEVELTDAVRLLQFLFLSGAAPSSPFPRCGWETADSPLGCGAFAACAS